MKKVVILVLSILTVTFAVNKNLTQVKTILVDDNKTITRTELNSTSRFSPINPLPSLPLIGRVEVIGYTTFDIQYNGPVYTHCRVDPVYGIHCYWLYSNFAPATDRNQRYNFYDFLTRTWLGDINVYTIRSGFGGMDYIPTGPYAGCAVASTHQTISAVITPKIGRDIAPGAGLFEYTQALGGYQWPAVGVTNNEAIHVADMTAADYALWYTRCQPWGTWSTPVLIPDDLGTYPMFPDHNIAASKTSNKVVIMWVCANDVGQMRGFYKLSADGGITWGTQTQIPFPPSTIATPSFWITSLFGMFDNLDNLHIVADVSDGSNTLPAEIWHYCQINPQPWTLIHHFDAESIAAGVGSNALFACRPSIVQAPGTTGNFYVAWEQFDSLNYEPLTSLLRGEIWVAELTNNGQTLTRKGRITDLNTTSKRTPCIGGVKNDTVFVQYLVDSIAGFAVAATPVGPVTNNPIILHRFHKNSLPVAIEEGNPTPKIYNFALSSATPNPSNITTKIAYSLPTISNVHLTIYDVLGRPIRTLVSGTKTPGEYSAIWDGRTNTGSKVQNGIYFYTLKSSDKSISRKLIRTY